MANWSNNRAGPSGAAELGQCATSSVVLWQRLSFDRKCYTIPQWSRQETRKSHVETVSNKHRKAYCAFSHGSPLIMPSTRMKRKEIKEPNEK